MKTETKPVLDSPSVWLSPGQVLLRDDRVFGEGCGAEWVRFLKRVFRVEEVSCVAIDRSRSSVAIHHKASPAQERAFLARLSDAMRCDDGPSPSLPPGARDTSNPIYRHGSILSYCEILANQPGRLQLRRAKVRLDPSLAAQVEAALESVSGVKHAHVVTWTGNLMVRYNPAVLRVERLVRLVEEALEISGGWNRSLPPFSRTPLAVENATLGLATVAEFALPILNPVTAMVLVAANLRTIQAAWLQLSRRKIGLPVLYSTILAVTLASGQFFASALMFWFFKFWQGRLALGLAVERRRLVDNVLPLPRLARLIARDGMEVLIPIDRLQPKDRVVVGADEAVPADGWVVAGHAIVDERTVTGLAGASRKPPGAVVLAGSTVLAGSITVEVSCRFETSQASSIVRSLVAATSPSLGSRSPHPHVQAFAEKAVGPTLATAGVGLLVGDLTAVAAILRPDYATGPGMAVPLELLRNAALCAGRGIVVRHGDVFDRLARTDMIVLGDYPGLWQRELEVVGIQSHLPETEILRLAASAFRLIDDARSVALATACRKHGVYLLDLPAVHFVPGVTVLHGTRKIVVRDYDPACQALGPLLVEIDATPVGLIRFARSNRLEASSALKQIRAASRAPVVLLSQRPHAEVAETGAFLKLDACRGDISSDEIARFLQGCRERGLRTTFLQTESDQTEAARQAFVTVSLANGDHREDDPASATLLQPRLELFATLWEIAWSQHHRVQDSRRFVIVPNVLCVAGALLFGFTGLTAVMLSNLGTMGLYNHTIRSLRSMDPVRRPFARLPR